MLPESFAPSSESLPPTSARVSIAPRSDLRPAVQMAAATSAGQCRSENEDDFLLDRGLGLAVLCDGMGGHAAGALASAIAVRAFREAVVARKEILRGYIDCQNAAVGVSKHDVAQLLQLAANAASRAVHEEAARDIDKRGMGTTLVAVLVLNNHAFVVNVGDSRAYLLRQGELEQLTRDHNVFNELVRRRKLSVESVKQVAPKNALTRAVGVYEHCEAEVLVIDVADGDRILLCSDGAYRYFEAPEGSPEELRLILLEEDDQTVVERVLERANMLGGKDNLTAATVTLGVVGDHDSRVLADLSAKREALANSPLFELLDERELLLVLSMTEVKCFYPGGMIIQQDREGSEMYVILSGAVAIYESGCKVAELQPGEHFGEMALLRERPRCAAAQSIGITEVLVIPREAFHHLLRSEHQIGMKLLWQFTSVLADRLADATRDLRASRDDFDIEDLSHDVFYEDDDARITERPPSRLPESK
jgi:serine/threonine protein phosphatase PrpC/CRP-like cAMP-binding protein